MGGPLEDLPNLGPVSGRWLRRAGFASRRDFASVGPVEAYLYVCGSGVKASASLLCAIAGAMESRHWQEVDRAGLLLEPDQRSPCLPLLD